MKHIIPGIKILILLLCCTSAEANEINGPTLVITVLHTPELVRINGKDLSYYEIGLRNVSKNDIIVNKLLVTQGRSSRQLLTLADNNILSHSTDKTSRLLKSNQSVYIYVEVTLSSIKKYGLVLNHTIDYTFNDCRYQSNLTLKMVDRRPIVLSPPLGTGNWAAVYNPAWERGHRRVFFTVDKKTRLPGRYAIDFIKLDDLGRQSVNDEDSIANWYGYGTAVLAVADAQVISAVDIYDESKTMSGQPSIDSSKATGNFIVLKLKEHVFAFYEHLKPGSIRVKQGDFVKKGQDLASLGFTGQSTGPHLHFHLADNTKPLGAEGIPYVFRTFTYKGFYNDFGDFGKLKWASDQTSGSIRNREFPQSNTVISFKQ